MRNTSFFLLEKDGNVASIFQNYQAVETISNVRKLFRLNDLLGLNLIFHLIVSLVYFKKPSFFLTQVPILVPLMGLLYSFLMACALTFE